MSDTTPKGHTCDTPGCGAVSTYRSTGDETEPGELGRAPVPRLNVCEHHRSWIFSEDARSLVSGNHKYLTRK